MRKIDKIIIHAADTPPKMDIGAAEIKAWHADPKPLGNGWSDIGYHYVIRRNGIVEEGRPLSTPGAHCRGQNANSVGICLVGGRQQKSSRAENNFTLDQFRGLKRLIRALKNDLPEATVHGHNEFSQKECPCFDVSVWLESYRV